MRILFVLALVALSGCASNPESKPAKFFDGAAKAVNQEKVVVVKKNTWMRVNGKYYSCSPVNNDSIRCR